MSETELNPFQIINEYAAKNMTQVDAALALSCDVRTISRIAKAVEIEGLGGIVHGNHPRVSWNKLDADEAERMKSPLKAICS